MKILSVRDPKEIMRKSSAQRVPRKSTSKKRSESGKRSRPNQWSLPRLLAGLHDDIHSRLETARKTLQHPGTKGDASEHVWLQLLDTYLPKRYQVTKAHVVDSDGNFSEQIDVVVLIVNTHHLFSFMKDRLLFRLRVFMPYLNRSNLSARMK